MREALVLRGQGRRGDLRDHEAGVEARLLGQERRQAAQVRVHEQGDPPLRHAAYLRDREREHVGGEADRLGVEVAPRQDLAGLGEDDRVVRHGVRLDLERRRRGAHQVEASAHDLGHAAQRIRILHPVLVAMRRPDRAARHEPAARRGHVRLAAMAARGVDARVEWRGHALARVERQHASDDRGGEGVLGREEPGERERGRDLRAVEQRQALLGGEAQRLQARGRERLGARHDASAHMRGASPDEDGREMRERREVARCAHGSLRGHAGMDAGGEQREQGAHDLRANRGMAAREADRLQGEDEPDRPLVEQGAGSGAVRKHEVELQRIEARRVDPRLRELAEARVHAVDRPVVGEASPERRHGRVDALPVPAGEVDPARRRGDRAQRRKAHAARIEAERRAHRP